MPIRSMTRPPHQSRLMATSVLALSVLVSMGADAAIYGFLDQGAVRYFRGDDARLMSANLDTVLAAPELNRRSEWRNPKTGSHGSAVAERGFNHDGMQCRRVRLVNHAGGIDGTTVADMCKLEESWKVLRLPE
jgi:surface antigen